MKFLCMIHETSRPSAEPPAELFAAMGALQAENTADGSLVEIGGLLPVEMTGAIVTLTGGSITTTDGPFVESKELVGGYAVYDVPDVAAAVRKSEAFLDIHRKAWPGWEGWIEVRAYFEAPAEFEAPAD